MKLIFYKKVSSQTVAFIGNDCGTKKSGKKHHFPNIISYLCVEKTGGYETSDQRRQFIFISQYTKQL